jgi:Na+/H+ antiporter NhaA
MQYTQAVKTPTAQRINYVNLKHVFSKNFVKIYFLQFFSNSLLLGIVFSFSMSFISSIFKQQVEVGRRFLKYGIPSKSCEIGQMKFSSHEL